MIDPRCDQVEEQNRASGLIAALVQEIYALERLLSTCKLPQVIPKIMTHGGSLPSLELQDSSGLEPRNSFSLAVERLGSILTSCPHLMGLGTELDVRANKDDANA